MSNKRLISVALMSMVFVALILVGSVNFGHASQPVSGIISSDTTWSPTYGPIIFKDQVFLNAGVTLTIEPGTTIEMLYNFYVNGEIIAKGTPTDPINITGAGVITGAWMIIGSSSPSYNNQTGTGSIIQNAIINCSITIADSSPKIDNNSITSGPDVAIEVIGDSPIISNNLIQGIKVENGTPTISNNNITTRFTNSIDVVGGSPKILNNNITSIITQQQTSTGWVPVKYPGIVLETGSGVSPGSLVHYQPVDPYIVGNRIFGCFAGIKGGQEDNATIQNNLIVNNTYGIAISSTKQVTIVNNTIANNAVGISLDHSPVANITDNNIEGNSQNSVYLQYTPNNVNAQDNWWGTTDAAAINQSIYDAKNNATLGTVIFTPFLTEPNPQAPVSPIASPTAEPTQTPTITPSTSPAPTSSPISPAPSTSSNSSSTAALSPSPSISPQSSASSQLGFYEVIAGLIAVIVVLAAVIAVLLVKIRCVTHK